MKKEPKALPHVWAVEMNFFGAWRPSNACAPTKAVAKYIAGRRNKESATPGIWRIAKYVRQA